MKEHYTVRRTLTSLVLQDGTNTLLKISQEDVSELFREFESLVTKSLEKFEPTKIFLCEVPPLRTNERNSVNNERITQWNNILHEKYKDEPNFQIIPLNEHIKSFKAPNTLYYDDIHFNFQLGLPLVKNCMMKYVTWHSSNIPRVSNEYRPKTDRAKRNYWYHQNVNTTDRPQRNYWYQQNPSNAYFHNPMTTYQYSEDAS